MFLTLSDQLAKLLRFLASPSQTIFIVVFILINGTLFYSSQEKEVSGEMLSSVYHQAADGQRYWAVARNLIEKREFSIPKKYFSKNQKEDAPLARAGPIPALFLSLPIWLVGFSNAPGMIVFMQCTLLFLMGFSARYLIEPFKGNKNLVQALVIFNPNLIGSSHLAQSDLLFAFFLCLCLLNLCQIFASGSSFRLLSFIFLGLNLGLLALTRPFSIYFLLALPLITITAYLCMDKLPFHSLIRFFKFALISVLISGAIMLPWAVRNYQVFGVFAISKSQGTMFEQQFELMLTHNGIEKEEWAELIDNAYIRAGHGDCTVARTSPHCMTVRTKVYFNAILDQPKLAIFKAFATAWSSLYLSGGTASVVKYLGLNKDTPFYFSTKHEFFSSPKLYIQELFKNDRIYLLFFIIFTSFAIVTRILGIVGIFSIANRKESIAHVIVHISTLAIFTGLYLFLTTSRLRVPLEIILMLYAALGMQVIWKRILPTKN